MPEYIYEHPKTKKVITIFQTMKEEHIYVDDKGVKWARIFSIPQANVSGLSSIDPFSAKDFMDKTSKGRGKMGDLWDLSSELSDKRARVLGKDPVKEEKIQKYRKKTGKRHPDE